MAGFEGMIWSRLTLDKNLMTSVEGNVLCRCISSTFCITSDINIMTVSRGKLSCTRMSTDHP